MVTIDVEESDKDGAAADIGEYMALRERLSRPLRRRRGAAKRALLDKHTQWLVTDLASGEMVRLYTNDICCPIWVENLAAAIVELAGNSDAAGHVNIAGTQPLSRWAFGLRRLAALGIHPGDNLEQPLLAGHSPSRPTDRTLNARRASMLLRTPLLTVDEALRLQTENEPRPWG